MVFALLKYNWPQHERCVENQRLAWLKCVKFNYLGQKELLLQEEKVRCLWKLWIVVFCSLSILSFRVSLLSGGVILLAAAEKADLGYSETLQDEVVSFLYCWEWPDLSVADAASNSGSSHNACLPRTSQKHVGKGHCTCRLNIHHQPCLMAGWDLNQFLWTNTVTVATFPFLGSSCGLMRGVVCP